MKPTVGRSIYFNNPNFDQVLLAFICYVWTDDLINIAGYTSDGVPFTMTSVPFNTNPEGEIPENEAGWMPYQKVQSDKSYVTTEEMQEAIKNKLDHDDVMLEISAAFEKIEGVLEQIRASDKSDEVEKVMTRKHKG